MLHSHVNEGEQSPFKDIDFMMDQLKKYLTAAIARKVYHKNLRSVTVFDRNEKPKFHFIYDIEYEQDIKWWYFEQRGWTVKERSNIAELDTLPLQPVYVTSEFWTCDCMEHFVHHKTLFTCPRCKRTVADHEQCLDTPTYLKGGPNA